MPAKFASYYGLLGFPQRAKVQFEGLVVFAFDLELRLEFLNEQFQPHDFRAKPLQISVRWCG